MNLENKIKDLEYRVSTQFILMEILVELLIKNEIVDEATLNEKMKEKIDLITKAADKIIPEEKKTKVEKDIEIAINPLYYGPHGDA